MEVARDASLFNRFDEGSLVAYEPWGEAFEDPDAGIQGLNTSIQNALGNQWFRTTVEIAAGFIPGVGEVQDAVGLYNAIMDRDPTGALMNGLSLAVGLFDPTPAGKAAVKAIFRNADDAAGLLTKLSRALGDMPTNVRNSLGDAIQGLDNAIQGVVGEKALQLAADGVDGNLLNGAIRNYSNPESTLDILQSARNTLGTPTVNRLAGSLNVGQISNLSRHLGPELTDDLARAFSGRMDGLAAFADRLQSMPARTRNQLVEGLGNVSTPTRALAADLVNAGIRPESIKDALVHTSNPQGTLQMIHSLASSTGPDAVNNVLRQTGLSNTMVISRAFTQNGANPTAQAFGDQLFERLGNRIDNLSNRAAQNEVSAARSLAQRELAAGGHSIQRHGPDVTDGELQRRLTQGVAPGDANAVNRPPPRSTRFNSYNTQNFLQQRSLDEAMQHLGIPSLTTPPSAIGLTSDYAPQVTIDWGQSIGTGFEGANRVKTKVGGQDIYRYTGTNAMNPNDVSATTIGLRWDGGQWQVSQFFPGIAGTGANAINRTP
ncbi:MAG: hypothetical protein AAF772_11120 [Acidobacteriota bacterium]